MALSAGELAAMTATVSASLSSSGTNGRTSASTPVRVGEDSRDTHLAGTWELLRIRRWRLLFALGTDVAVGDRIAVTGMGTYAVAEMATPHSLQTGTLVYAFLLFDASGAPVFFTATHSLQIRRDLYNAGTKQSTPTTISGTVSVYVQDVSNDLRLRGISGEYGLMIVCDSSVDLRDGDRLLGYNPGTAGAGLQAPIVQVQHVARHQMAGWDYKTALAKAVTP